MLKFLTDLIAKHQKGIEHLFTIVPFFLIVGNKPTINFQRIVEAILIAALAGLFGSYLSVKQMEIKNVYTEKQINRLVVRMDKIEALLWNLESPNGGPRK